MWDVAKRTLQNFGGRGTGSAMTLFGRLQQLGPYLLVELLLPGGTLLALGMYVYRHKRGLIVARVRP